MTRRHRQILAGLTAGLLVVTAAITGVYLSGERGEHEGEAEGEFPTALGQHIEKLMEAIPGDQGMSSEGPGSAAEAAFLARAIAKGLDGPIVHELEALGFDPRQGRVHAGQGQAVPVR